jgi:NAD-dependent deacetylase
MVYQRVVVLTGAGISAESGIKTFRAADGLWEEHRVEDVATPEGFVANPRLVQRFYNERRRQLLSAAVSVNPAHLALAEFEKKFSGELLLVTQNIDDLHERAGSQKLIHMHGELLKMQCSYSGVVYPIATDISAYARCACCGLRGGLRPHIVLGMDEIYTALEQCDLFIAVGTSGNVYPAAGFVQAAASVGAHTIEVNLEPSAVQSAFSETRYGLASVEVPRLLNELLAATTR